MIDTDCLNILVLGDAGVGKTHMYQEYTGTRDGLFSPATVCLEVHAKSLCLGGRVLDACFYDVTGDPCVRLGLQNLLRRLVEGGLRLHAVNLHCDASQPQTIDAMLDWAAWAQAACSRQAPEGFLGAQAEELEALPVFITASMHVDGQSKGRIAARLQAKHGICAADAIACFPADDYRLSEALDEALANIASHSRHRHRSFLPLKYFIK